MAEEDRKQEAYDDLMSQIGAGASAEGAVAQVAFTQFFCEFLDEKAHYVSDLIPVYFNTKWKSANVRVDAYHLDEQTHDLTLVISEFSQSKTIEAIGVSDVRNRFEQVRRFFRASCNQEFRTPIEDSEEVMPLVHLIRDNCRLITRVRYILITNKTLGNRVKDSSFDDMKSQDGTVASEFTVWDFARYYDSLDKPEQEIEVDCRPHSPGEKGLPFLTSPMVGLKRGSEDEREYEAYLLMVPGRLVRDWYARYADRLLEQNVRTFLQFKGKVNRGIRETLHGEPNRFFAYNNGLTATADEVEFNASGDRIVTIKNLQIVNGGQTTASIYTAFAKDDAEIDQISVQMKLVVTSGPQFEELVSKISRFANSQNKIKDTDLASNKRFMLRIESLSRKLTANPGGSLRGTRWFFERTRGQYLNAINMRAAESDKKAFKALYPKSQVFTKTDMAKYVLAWDWAPWIVAKGGEKAFAEFDKRHFGSGDDLPGRESVNGWRANDSDDNPQFSQYYYQELVGKAILYRELDNALRKSEWCKGFKSQIIAYTISLLHFIVWRSKKVFNFYSVWNTQTIPMVWMDYLVGLAQGVQKLMIETAGARNVGEWAKSSELWVVVKRNFMEEGLPQDLLASQLVMDVAILESARSASEREQIRANGNSLLRFVLATEDRIWDELELWLKANNRTINVKVSNAQSEALSTRLFYKSRLDVADAKKLLKLWQQAAKEGFPYPPLDEVE